MLPRDFDILPWSKSSQPLARTERGVAMPAAIKNAGQYTQWKRLISLPIR
jgi:hypothetical protein